MTIITWAYQDPVPLVFPPHCSVLPFSHDGVSVPASDRWASSRAKATHFTFLCLQLQILGHLVIWEGAVRKFILSRVPSGAKAPLQKNL